MTLMPEDTEVRKRIEYQAEWRDWFWALDKGGKDFTVTQMIEWLTKEQLKLVRKRTLQAKGKV